MPLGDCVCIRGRRRLGLGLLLRRKPLVRVCEEPRLGTAAGGREGAVKRGRGRGLAHVDFGLACLPTNAAKGCPLPYRFCRVRTLRAVQGVNCGVVVFEYAIIYARGAWPRARGNKTFSDTPRPAPFSDKSVFAGGERADEISNLLCQFGRTVHITAASRPP